nr:hypothetical protein [Tanacetum cinerariifolium]
CTLKGGILPSTTSFLSSSVDVPVPERKPKKDRGTRRGRHSTSSSTFNESSSSHLNDDDDDDDDDGNNEGTSRESTPSPIRYVNSLTNEVPQLF